MEKKRIKLTIAVLAALILVFVFGTIIFGKQKSEPKGYLGVVVEPIDRHLKKELNTDYGLVVCEVEIDSPADKFGLMEDDVLQQLNGVKIRRPHTLTRLVRKIKPGESAEIKLLRDGEPKTISVVIGKFKSDFKNFPFANLHGDNTMFTIFTGEGSYLGVQLAELSENLAPYFNVKPYEGVLILKVEEDSPAEEAELKPGDVITSIDGEKVADPEAVTEIIAEFEPDEEIEIAIVRMNKPLKMKVTLEKRQSEENIFLKSPGRGGNIYVGPERLHFNWHDKDIKLDLPKIKTEKKLEVKSLPQSI